jgi:hypothetical protein
MINVRIKPKPRSMILAIKKQVFDWLPLGYKSQGIILLFQATQLSYQHPNV